MPTIEELIKRYRTSEDDELFRIHRQREEFTAEARTALDSVIDEKGGLIALESRIQNEKLIEEETQRLSREIDQLISEGKQQPEISRQLKCEYLSAEECDELIYTQLLEFENLQKDKKLRPRTIVGGLIGGAIGSVLAGIMWGAQMIYSGQIF